jgi:predicted enzyme related to lactoylglutathione lyase
MKSALNHFEIPVHEMARAVACQEALLGTRLRRETFNGLPYALFPHEDPRASGGPEGHIALVLDSEGNTVGFNDPA